MEKPNVLIIGAGGVAQVTAHKVAQHAAEFGAIHMANRTQAKADAIVDSIRDKGTAAGLTITTHALDAMDADKVAALIRETGAKIVINVGTAFINKTVLKGCIAAGAAYIDTAIHEDPAKICETPPWYGNYEWKRREAVEAAGITDAWKVAEPLAAAGVDADWIGHCTYGDPARFFSYRRSTHLHEADYGRLISAITL
mgnify:CR=1 FL=1